MILATKEYKAQALNAFLRFLSMVAKLALALYMGRYFALADMGAYGLVFATVAILSALLGQRFDYIVMRDIVGAAPETVLYKMRDQAILYGMNYLALAAAILTLIAIGHTGIETKYLMYILVLTIVEGYASISYFNMNSLNHQVMANAMFFIRSGAWVVPVILLCMVNPAWRTADTILAGWSIGGAISLVATLWFWRYLPWREVMPLPVSWEWIRQGVKKCFPLWLGMAGLLCGSFVDRFVVDHYLSLDYVGVLTFYSSFTNAILTLMQSGVMAFAYPRLIASYRDRDVATFDAQARKAVWQIALGAGILAVCLGIIVPLFGRFFNRPVFIAEAWTFWLMLFGTWLRANADAIFNILFARHQDRAIWMGNLLFLIPAFGCNFIFVPLVGFSGIGYSTIIAALFLLLWRSWYTRYP